MLKIFDILQYVIKISGNIQGHHFKLKALNMKTFFNFLYGMILLLLFSGESLAQQLMGESDPFVFDTRQPDIPLSNSVLLIFFILAGSLILYRYYMQKRKATI